MTSSYVSTRHITKDCWKESQFTLMPSIRPILYILKQGIVQDILKLRLKGFASNFHTHNTVEPPKVGPPKVGCCPKWGAKLVCLINYS